MGNPNDFILLHTRFHPQELPLLYYWLYPAEIVAVSYFCLVLWSFDSFICLILYLCAVCVENIQQGASNWSKAHCRVARWGRGSAAAANEYWFHQVWKVYEELLSIVDFIHEKLGLVSKLIYDLINADFGESQFTLRALHCCKYTFKGVVIVCYKDCTA
jgi:hypothetical protein